MEGILIASYAQSYDQTFAFFKDYSRESAFIRQLIERYQPSAESILDVACGTGTHIAELVGMGFQGIALDIDPDILAIAGQKTADQGATLKTLQQDMRDFRLTPPACVVINMFYSFQNALANEADQERCLQSIKASLRQGGILIMELLPEENNLQQFPPGQIFRVHQAIQIDGTELVVTSQNRLLDATHKEIDFIYETFQQGRMIMREVLVSPLYRMFYQTIHDLLQRNGFAIIAEFGDYSVKAPFTADSTKIIIVARKET